MADVKQLMKGFLMNAYKIRMRLDEGIITHRAAKKTLEHICNEAHNIQKTHTANKNIQTQYQQIMQLNKEVRKKSLTRKRRTI